MLPGLQLRLQSRAGVSQRATVRVNGTTIGHHVGAFTAFCCEATRQMKPEVNLLEVEVDVLSHFGISGGKYGLKLSSDGRSLLAKEQKGLIITFY